MPSRTNPLQPTWTSGDTARCVSDIVLEAMLSEVSNAASISAGNSHSTNIAAVRSNFVMQNPSAAASVRSLVLGTNSNIGRVGSRTLRRKANDSLRDHPLGNQILVKDATPPGYTHQLPQFHFTLAHRNLPEAPPLSTKTKKKKKVYQSPTSKSTCRQFKRSSLARHTILRLESEVLAFINQFLPPSTIKEETEVEVEEDWVGFGEIKEEYLGELDAILVSLPNLETQPNSSSPALVCALPCSFQRLILHTLCKHYRLRSKSRDEPQGHKSVVIYPPPSFNRAKNGARHRSKDVALQPQLKDDVRVEAWSPPPVSFFDWVFGPASSSTL